MKHDKHVLQGSCHEETHEQMKNSFVKMSASFPDPSKAEGCFQRLNEMKDNTIFNSLEELLDNMTIKNAEILRVRLLLVSCFTLIKRNRVPVACLCRYCLILYRVYIQYLC